MEAWHRDFLGKGCIGLNKELFKMNFVLYKPSRNFEAYLIEVRKKLNSILSNCSLKMH